MRLSFKPENKKTAQLKSGFFGFSSAYFKAEIIAFSTFAIG